MDVHWTGGDERRIRRIIALLVSLAVLAERAAARSFPVRFIVLWLLRRAEAVVGDFIFDATGRPSAIGGIVSVGNDPADALRLAARLHALAAALRALLPAAWLAAARRLDRRPRQCGFAFGPLTPCAIQTASGSTRTPNDTS